MKRAIVVIILTVFEMAVSYGQMTATFGSPIEAKTLNNDFLIKGYTKETFLAGYFSGPMFSKINYYSFGQQDLNVRENFDISKIAPFKPSGLMTQSVNMGDRMVLLAEEHNSKKDKKEIYAIPFSPDGKPGIFVKLIEEESVLGLRALVMADSQQLCILVLLKKVSPSMARMKAYRFNKNLEKIGATSIELPVSNKKYNYGEVLFARGNRIIIPCYTEINPEQLVKGGPIATPSICQVDLQTGKLTECELKVQDMIIWDLDFGIDASEKIIVAGFYGAVENKKKKVKGMYCLTIDPKKNEVVKASTKEMPEEVAALIDSDESLNGSDLFTFGTPIESDHFGDSFLGGGLHVKDLITRKNGDRIILVERSSPAAYSTPLRIDNDGFGTKPRFVSPFHNTSNTMGGLVVAYYTSGVLALSVNSAGEIAWVRLLPVKQDAEGFGNDFSVSILSACTSDKVFVLYNDSKKNRSKGITEFKDAATNLNPAHGVPTIVEITADGRVFIKQAFDESIDGNEYQMVTSQYLRIKPDELIITLMGKRLSRLGRLSFK